MMNAHGTYSASAVGEPHRTMQQTAISEKKEMLNLNDRLSSLLQQLREADAKHGEPYREATRILEGEINKLKKMYDAEIKKLSDAIESLNREKSGHLADLEKKNRLLAEFQKRVELEQANAARLAAELEEQTRRAAEREREMAELKGAIDMHKAEIARLTPDHARLNNENTNLRNKLENETRERMGKEEALKQLNDHLAFNKNKQNQEASDMAARLKSANDIIKSLERKLKQYVDGNSLTETLKKLRECTAGELARYQAESEAALNKALSELRGQVDTRGNTEAIRKDKARLEEQLQAMKGKMADLEAHLNSALQQKRDLEDALQTERMNSQKAISEMERKLQELQRTMMERMKEYNTARDMQVSLQTEIDAYRKMVDLEDTRLNKPMTTPRPMSSSRSPVMSAQQRPKYGSSHGPNSGMMDSSKSALPRILPTTNIYNPYNTIYRTNYVHPARRFLQSETLGTTKDMTQSMNSAPSGTSFAYGSVPAQSYLYTKC